MHGNSLPLLLSMNPLFYLLITSLFLYTTFESGVKPNSFELLTLQTSQFQISQYELNWILLNTHPFSDKTFPFSLLFVLLLSRIFFHVITTKLCMQKVSHFITEFPHSKHFHTVFSTFLHHIHFRQPWITHTSFMGCSGDIIATLFRLWLLHSFHFIFFQASELWEIYRTSWPFTLRMEDSWIPFCFLISATFFLAPFQLSNAQLVPTESRIMFQVQELLEYPQALQAWNNWTNFCFLPPTPSLTIVCSGDHITELTIVGNRSSPSQINPKLSASNFAVSQHTLSDRFSTDSFFTVLTKLSSLQKLSLVSLGLWGPLPAKVNRFRSLEVLNISSNFLYGELPQSVSSYQSLRSLVLSDNLFNGSVVDLRSLSLLEEVDLSNNYFGPNFPSLSSNLGRIDLGSNSLRSEIPQDLKKFIKLQFLDVSSNKLVGPIPSLLFSLPSVEHISLAKNQLSGAFPPNASCNGNLNFVDVSNNLLIGKLPSCLGSNVGNKTVVIMWNCLSNTTSKYQRPHAFCQKDALAVMPSVRNQEEESTLKLGIVLGIIGGVVAILGGLCLLVLVIYRRMQSKKGSEYRSESFVMEKSPVRGSPIGSKPMICKCVVSVNLLCSDMSLLLHFSLGHVPQPMRMTSLGLPPYHVFTLEDMEDATNSFDPSNLVGEGAQGQVLLRPKYVCVKVWCQFLCDLWYLENSSTAIQRVAQRWLCSLGEMPETKTEAFSPNSAAAYGSDI